jgi:hypothetical protein
MLLKTDDFEKGTLDATCSLMLAEYYCFDIAINDNSFALFSSEHERRAPR